MEALVYKSTGSWYVTKTADGQTFNARIKGLFKKEGITSTNPIAVGDCVEMEMENELEKTTTITQIKDRTNYVARQSPHNKHSHHIVAANLDQSVLFATLKEPRTSTGFIDRFVVACEMYHVPAVIVFNKSDIYRKKELDLFEQLKQVYTNAGYKVLLISVNSKAGLHELDEILHNKTTLISGHSGVGKSSFINLLFPHLSLRTKEVSGWSGKGLHTTTFAEMFDLPNGGRVIDTPGIREMGLVDVSKQELSGYFPEMKALVNECQFNNCVHINEPGCAVKKEISSGNIATERYLSYLNILDSLAENSWE